jgi:uncharacterized damage-inducible protein DinB
MHAFLERYASLQGRMLPSLLDALTDEQIRSRPHVAANSIAWLLWHIARCEDVYMNRLLSDRPQVLEEEGWLARLDVNLRRMGTGMTDEEVAELSARINIPALRAYYDAVGRRATEVVASLRPETFDEVVEEARIHRVLYDEGVLGDNADYVVNAYRGHTKGYFLMLALTHKAGHLGQAGVVRRLHGFHRLTRNL